MGSTLITADRDEVRGDVLQYHKSLVGGAAEKKSLTEIVSIVVDHYLRELALNFIQ